MGYNQAEVQQGASRQGLASAARLLRNASAGRLNYGLAGEQQLPIGSGILESTVRRVLNLRMKGASIFWTQDNAEDTILPRAYYKSGHWQVLENKALTANCQLAA